MVKLSDTTSNDILYILQAASTLYVGKLINTKNFGYNVGNFDIVQYFKTKNFSKMNPSCGHKKG